MFRARDIMTTVSSLLLLLTFSVGWFSVGCGSAAVVKDYEVRCQPQHVHLSLGEAEDQMAVVWATNGTCDTKVLYSTSQWLTGEEQGQEGGRAGAGHHPTVTGREETYTEHNARGLHVLHKATMTGLEGSKTYFYRPTSHNVGAGPFFFQTPPRGTDWSPELLVVSDLGPHSELLPHLTEEALSGRYTAALQLGGLTSYLADVNGTRGDRLMQGLEHLAAFLPVMTTPGQNETVTGGFPGYRHRFSMPGSPWPMREEKLWYSFNLGPVHFVSLCTDVYLQGNQTQQTLQYQWLVKDLSKANTEREKRPWIVAFGYHPMYCTSHGQGAMDCAKSDSLVRKGLEETLYYYGVDLVLLSHPQGAGYERLYPLFKGVVASTNYTNPRAPVHILSGLAPSLSTTTPTATATSTTTAKPVVTASSSSDKSAAPAAAAASSGSKAENKTTGSSSSSSSGSSSGSSGSSGNSGSTGETAKDSGEAKPADPSEKAPKLAAFKFVGGNRLTYGRLHILNATHAHWELLSGSAEEAAAGSGEKVKGRKEVLDSMMLVQEHHGKFQLSELPDDVGEKIGQNMKASGGEPGVLNVHDPVLETEKMLAADDSRRLIIGASFGALVLLIVVVVVVVKVRGKARRRTVRRWDVMDYKYGKTKLYTPTNDRDDDDDDDDDFQDDHDFEMDIPDGSMQTKKLINGK